MAYMGIQTFLRASRAYVDDVFFIRRLRRLHRLRGQSRFYPRFERLSGRCNFYAAPTAPALPAWAIEISLRFARLHVGNLSSSGAYGARHRIRGDHK